MATVVYGASDDLVEVDGDVRGEVGFYTTREGESGCVFLSDGTILRIAYDSNGIWRIAPIRKGDLFDSIDVCGDEDPSRGNWSHSDLAKFKEGITGAWFARDFQKVE